MEVDEVHGTGDVNTTVALEVFADESIDSVVDFLVGAQFSVVVEVSREEPLVSCGCGLGYRYTRDTCVVERPSPLKFRIDQ